MRALKKRRTQYAAYAIHLALLMIAIGVTGSALGSQRTTLEMNEGESVEWVGRRIEFKQLVQREAPGMLIAEADLRISRSGMTPITLLPARHYHMLQDSWTTEVAIHSTWAGDFSTVLDAGLGDGRIALTLVNNPMMRWIWCGGWLASVSSLVAIWPRQMRSAIRTITLSRTERKAA